VRAPLPAFAASWRALFALRCTAVGTPLSDGDSKPVQLGCLVRVVAQQGYPVQPQGTQHLRRDRVVAVVLAVAEREVGVVRVEAGVLQAVASSFAYRPIPRSSWRR
jgi:hypothetical protein